MKIFPKNQEDFALPDPNITLNYGHHKLNHKRISWNPLRQGAAWPLTYNLIVNLNEFHIKNDHIIPSI